MPEEKNTLDKESREQLKKRFSAGNMPAEEDFHCLIDSVVNSIDEGIVVSEANGMELRPRGDNGCLISLFQDQKTLDYDWSVNIVNNKESKESSLNVNMRLNRDTVKNAVTLVSKRSDNPSMDLPNVNVGIGCNSPKGELDVNGMIASRGRVGYEDEKYKVIADGEWYDVTDVLTGCQCFEVVAGVGGLDGDGRFALTHAIAVNVFNSHPSVNITRSYSGGGGSKIDVRWHKCKNKFEFTLQLRVRSNFKEGKKVQVRYHLTKLWYDTQMNGSIVK